MADSHTGIPDIDVPPSDVPQAVDDPLTDAAVFLTLQIPAGKEAAVNAALGDITGLRKAVGFRVPASTLSCVTGIGSDAWDRLFSGPRPKSLHPFQALKGAVHEAPATPGDLLFHIRSTRLDLCFDLAMELVRRLGDAAEVIDEVHGFRTFDQRDLLGFADGTANPEGGAKRAATLVGQEDPDFVGGSYVIAQKYLHDLKAWDGIPVEEQEKVIGRSKLDDIEMPDDVKPIDSHVALNTIEADDGNEQDIYRLNMPFGQVGRGEYGTYFIGYARDPQITEQMLRNMFIGRPAGNTDRILEFSTAKTGTLFFVPTEDFLGDPPAVPSSDQGNS